MTFLEIGYLHHKIFVCTRFVYFCRMPPQKKTVIVCPLDWGLGHATRMVPIIELFLAANAHVVIASDKRPLAFLKQRLPGCDFERLPGYTPKYPKQGFLMPFTLMMSFPRMMKKARESRELLMKMAKKNQADLIISDNRYELSIPGITSIFITHQLHIQSFGWQKIFSPFINLMIRKYLNRYQEVWIPDFEGEKNLSGILAHPTLPCKPKQTYIGLLTRFASIEKVLEKVCYDIVIILSGPEPQRSLLEANLIQQALELKKSTLILQGKPEENQDVQLENLRVISHKNDTQMAAYILSAQLVVCRPGYSTLMDLAHLQTKAAFIPTPGQTEQIYLAKKLLLEKSAYSDTQKNFSLQKAYESRHEFTGLPYFGPNTALKNSIDQLLSSNSDKNKQPGQEHKS